MSGLFAGTPLERPVTCEACGRPRADCRCPRDAEGRVCLPADQPLIVRVESRRRGKTVTTIRGLDPEASDRRSLLGRLKRACGAGGSCTDDAIEVQGDHAAAVTVELESIGYPVRRV